jgi:hypothetical protein
LCPDIVIDLGLADFSVEQGNADREESVGMWIFAVRLARESSGEGKSQINPAKRLGPKRFCEVLGIGLKQGGGLFDQGCVLVGHLLRYFPQPRT